MKIRKTSIFLALLSIVSITGLLWFAVVGSPGTPAQAAFSTDGDPTPPLEPTTPPPLKPTVPPKAPADPTPTPRPSVPEPEPDGGVIELVAQLPSSGTVRLREVFTVVQWQDGNGDWHDVEGWRGQLDAIVGQTVLKTWWVSEDHLGAGPFRWRVYWDVYTDASGGTARVLESSPFYLPGNGQTVVVEMSR